MKSMETEHDRGVAGPVEPCPSERENTLCSVAADLEAVICKLDDLGLSLAAARVSHGLEVVREAIQNLGNGGNN
jgi:hypothetical protein